MKRTILFTGALASAASLFAIGAIAQDQGTPSPTPIQSRMSLVEIATMLENQGYTVREIEMENGHYDVEMTDANGLRVSAYLDPVTGDVLRHVEDDDYRKRSHNDDGYDRDDD